MWLVDTILHRGNDLSTYFLPNAYFFKQSILKWHLIPAWNPIQFNGMPYLADPQNFIFYLPNYSLALLPVETAFLVLLLVHFIWAAVGIYKLSKTHFGLSSLFSIFCALLFIFTPKFFAHLEAGHYTMLIAFSWLPWFMHLALKFVNKPQLKTTILLSLVTFILYINYINIAYFSLLFYAVYLFWHLIFRPSKKLIKKYLILNTLYLILFTLLVAPVLIPQLKFAPQSTRSLITYTDAAQPIWSFKLFSQNLFFPFVLNSQQLATERVLFPGLIVWVLSILGWQQYRGRNKWFYLSWLVFSILFALGDRVPFFIYLYKFFPLMSWLRITTRPWIITLLFLAIFAGLGLRHILSKKNLATIFVLGTLCLLELVYVDIKIFAKPIAVDPTPVSFYALITEDTHRPFRVYCTTGCFSLQKLGELGIWSLSGNNPIQSSKFVNALQSAAGYSYGGYSPALPPYQVFSSKPQPNAKLMAQLQTKYIASPYELTDQDLDLISQDSGYFLYANRVFSLQ